LVGEFINLIVCIASQFDGERHIPTSRPLSAATLYLTPLALLCAYGLRYGLRLDDRMAAGESRVIGGFPYLSP
jgi:hypothetical protein